MKQTELADDAGPCVTERQRPRLRAQVSEGMNQRASFLFSDKGYGSVNILNCVFVSTKQEHS